MTRDEAKDYVKAHLDDYLRLMHPEINVYSTAPFRCLNPDHRDTNPSMCIDRSKAGEPHCHCFGCGAHYDTLDLVSIDFGLTNYKQIFDKAYEIFELDVQSRYVPRTAVSTSTIPQPVTRPLRNPVEQVQRIEDTPAALIDISSEIYEAHLTLMNTPGALAYYQSRGLSIDTIRNYRLGYAPFGHNQILRRYPEHQSNSQKIDLYKYILPYPPICPTQACTYFSSEIIDRRQMDKFNKKYRKINNLKQPLFNERYLCMDPAPPVVFITEGIYDALSLEDVGVPAIALVGVGARHLIDICARHRPKTHFMIGLDNDDTGKQAADSLAYWFATLHIDFTLYVPPYGKDWNDSLKYARPSLYDWTHSICREYTE